MLLCMPQSQLSCKVLRFTCKFNKWERLRSQQQNRIIGNGSVVAAVQHYKVMLSLCPKKMLTGL